ncbi:helix-turn-helix transcriptional regulator [Nocardia sp. NPDC004604]|uniref:helix-turn-helix domain-containing protein n=1 Tax=Nocardia sp. NPDC004604 TaxID=3157013 RepID=UPI0033AC0E60
MSILRTRRARLTPGDVGMATAGRRRTPGLRREEVAVLAGVSVDYYVRLERGRTPNASASVLEAVARALRLDPAERAHLFDLAEPGRGSAVGVPRRPSGCGPDCCGSWTP